MLDWRPWRVAVLYLNKDTFVGSPGQRLADELRRVRGLGTPGGTVGSTRSDLTTLRRREHLLPIDRKYGSGLQRAARLKLRLAATT